ncbi:MAG: AMP-binding protein, partial [Bacteroidetes bacterium]|nr:AMP-binding protein [Bacteroidota bacterium]
MNVANVLLEKADKLNKDFVAGTEKTLSYKELFTKVNALAAFLNKKFGAGKEIMLLSENNSFFIISYLAIIKSGNIVILTETKISEAGLKDILNRCSLSGFLVQDYLKSKLDSKE